MSAPIKNVNLEKTATHDDFDPRQYPDPEAMCSWAQSNPTTVIDAAGMNLTQALVDFILKKLRNGQGCFEPQLVNVRILNLQINRLPDVVKVSFTEDKSQDSTSAM